VNEALRPFWGTESFFALRAYYNEAAVTAPTFAHTGELSRVARGGGTLAMRPEITSSWLEGASETQPTRTAAQPEGDVAQVNARNEASAFTGLVLGSADLAAWRSLWA